MRSILASAATFSLSAAFLMTGKGEITVGIASIVERSSPAMQKERKNKGHIYIVRGIHPSKRLESQVDSFVANISRRGE